MIVLDYKKDTGKFTIHISDTLSQEHIEFLQKFTPSKEHDRPEFSMDELFKPKDDDDTWRETHQCYWELEEWGFLENVYDHHESKEMVRLTELGRIMLNKISGKPQRNQK